MRNQQVLSPTITDELTAEQVERVFAAMDSDGMKRLYKIKDDTSVFPFNDHGRKRDQKGRFLIQAI